MDRNGEPRPAHWRPEHGDLIRTPHQWRMHSVQTLMTEPHSSIFALAISCTVIGLSTQKKIVRLLIKDLQDMHTI